MAITRGITDGGAEQVPSSSYEYLFRPTDTAADTSGGGRPEAIEITNSGSANATIRSWSWLTLSGAAKERVLLAGDTIVIRGRNVTNGSRGIPGDIEVKSAGSTTIAWGPV